MTINEIRDKAFKDAKDHGFYPDGHSVQKSLMDIICEVTEAVDADEKGKRSTIKNPDYEGLIDADWGGVKSPGYGYFFQQTAKDTLEDELADIIIRTASLAGYLNIDLETHIRAKMKYNEGRPHLHGKRY